MVQFTVERVIDVPPSRAWSILSDFRNVHKVHPMVRSVSPTTPQSSGMDAGRTCHFYDGGRVSERITAWSDVDRTYSILLQDGTLPLHSATGTFSATPHGSGTRLVGVMDMSPKYGPAGWLMATLFMKPRFGVVLGSMFAGIEEFAKTGKEIPQGYTQPSPSIVR